MKHPITLRIDNELLQATRHRAQIENRTLTNFVETVLKRHIATAVAVSDASLAKAEEPAAMSVSTRSGTKRTSDRKIAHG